MNAELARELIERAKAEREKSLYHFSQNNHSLHIHLEGVAMGLELAAALVAAKTGTGG